MCFPKADIKYCQEAACKDSEYAYQFARDIPGADVQKCQEAACKEPEYAYYFANYIKGADKEYCRQHTIGTPWEFKIDDQGNIKRLS